MASFTDIIPQFNPYIQQLPVEAMVKIGMQKQSQYDEGIQKIQTNINNVAGLDVLRDVDRSYLQSKLNELGNNLRTVAAGDFSNFQLVNSVGGMVTQLTKDDNVQNAVNSTAWYRKESAAMEQARKEGKSSQSNIYDFTQKANTWLSSDDLSAQFRDRYTPYTDVKKKALEAIKLLHPKLTQYDVPFEIKNGVINTEKIADAMQRNKIEGVDEGQIKQAISATLTPDDINQLSIDAKYQFRGVDSNKLVNVATANYIAQKTDAETTLAYLKEQKSIITDPTLSEKVSKRIEEYEDMLGKDGKMGTLDESLAENIDKAKNDPDGVKLNLYKDGFIKEFANAFSWKNQEMQLMANPIRQQMNWVEDMKQKKIEFSEKIRQFNLNYEQDERKIQLDAEANALKKIELYGDPNSTDWTPIGNPTDNALRSVEIFTGHIDASSNKIKGIQQQLAEKFGGEAKANIIINDWEKNQGVVSKLNYVPAAAIGLLQSFSKEKAYLSGLQKKENDIKKEVDAEMAKDPTNIQKLQKANLFASSINDGKPLTLIGDNNITKTVTPKEMMNKIISGRAKLQIGTSLTHGSQLIYDDGEVRVAIDRQNVFGPSDSPEVKQARKVFEKILDYEKTSEFRETKDVTNKYNDIYGKKLAPIAQEFVPQIKALPLDKDRKLPPVLLQNVSKLITRADILDIAANKNFSVEKASEFLTDEKLKDTRVFIQQDGDKYTVRIKSEKDASNYQDLSLTEGEVIQYFGQGYVNPRKNETMRLKVGKGNTNINSNVEESVMQKSFGDFPNIRKYEITADFEQDMSNPDLYIPYINIKNKAGRWVTFPIPGSSLQSRVGFENGRTNLNNLTDDVLIKALKAQYPNFDFSTLD